MALPVPDLTAALEFYQAVLGFRIVSRSEAPPVSAVLARDGVQIGLIQNGGDPTQDGCAFHVRGVAELFAELQAKSIGKELSQPAVEENDGAAWKVFYVVAPDGLCFWFGERVAND